MTWLKLFVDPRGKIGRRAYWGGLGFMAIPQIVVWLWATGQSKDTMALISLAVVGAGIDPAALFSALTPVWAGALLSTVFDHQTMPSNTLSIVVFILIVAARLYPMAVLGVKRSRDAGRGAKPVIALGLVTLITDAATWAWSAQVTTLAYDAVLWSAPVFTNLAVVGLSWIGTMIWLGVIPPVNARARSAGR